MHRLSRPHTRLALVGWALLTVLAFSFVVWPAFDIAVTDAIHDPARDPAFFLGEEWWVLALFHGTPLLGRTLVVIALLVVVLGLWARFGQTFGRWRRRSVLLLIIAAVGHGIVVSWLLKEEWERPRPRDVQLFGGPHPFVVAGVPSPYCERNCSFVSGHAATGYVLMAVGLLSAPAVRRRWTLIAIGTGFLIGAGRVLQGGHFASDIVFGALFIGLVCWATRAIWLRRRLARWRRLRPGGAVAA
jgi:lipid A 4'-phosphatase